MQNKMFKRFISLALILAMMATFLPQISFVISAADKNSVIVQAQYDTPITITKKPEPPKPPEPPIIPKTPVGKVFQNTYYNKTIERDYAQNTMIGVKNYTDKTIQFYLECPDFPNDLAMGFIGNGSKDTPNNAIAGRYGRS